MNTDLTVGRGREHDHAVGFYRRDDDLVSAVADFLAGALDSAGAAVVLATPAHRAAIDRALGARGFSVDALTDGARYRSFDVAGMLARFMRDGRPAADDFSSTIEAILDEIPAPRGSVRIFGEMVAVLWDAGNVSAAIELESHWNAVAAEHNFALYCAYPMSSLEAANNLAAAKQVCDRHSRILPLSGRVGRHHLPVAADGDDVECFFLPTPDVPQAVRSLVRDVLGAWNEHGLVPEAELIASELATNAVMHARSPFLVSLARTSSAVRIAVRDASTEYPKQRDTDAEHGGGRGIALVAALSHTWDAQIEADGKTIWAAMTREHP